MNVNDIGTLIGFILPIFLAIAGYSMAKKRNRKGWLWFINCWLTGLIGIIILAVSKRLNKEIVKSTLPFHEEETEIKEADTLGWIILIIGLIVFVLQIYFGYEMAKSYHNQMFWNFHNSIIR